MALDRNNNIVPQVSVIMTVFNAERYVIEAMNSILHQSFSNFEFIIVDDGSTDGSAALIRRVDDPRIRFYQCEHKGRSASLNAALVQARGDFIAFMDADDMVLEDRLAKQYDVLQKKPHVGIVSAWFQLMDEEGRKLKVVRKAPEYHAQIEHEMTIQCSMCFGCCMVRRELIRHAGVFNEQLQAAVDYDLFLRAAPMTEFYNLQEILLYYRIHASTLSSLHHKEQLSNTFRIAKQYLETILEKATSVTEKNGFYFRLGLNEYYRGSMSAARRYFLSALPDYWKQWSFWRYLLPTFLGDRFFHIYRQQRNQTYTS